MITNDSEQIFYAVLDTLSQGAFALALLYLTKDVDMDRLKLAFEDWGRIGRGHHSEKQRIHHGVDEGRPSTVYTEEHDHANHGYMNGGAGATTSGGNAV